VTDKDERMEEFWVVCADFPKYSVSNYGNVRNNRTGRDLQPKVRKDGYVRVYLWLNGYQLGALVHRLVAKAFFVNYSEFHSVTHMNDIRHDNSVVNLTLGTKKIRRRDF